MPMNNHPHHDDEDAVIFGDDEKEAIPGVPTRGDGFIVLAMLLWMAAAVFFGILVIMRK